MTGAQVSRIINRAWQVCRQHAHKANCLADLEVASRCARRELPHMVRRKGLKALDIAKFMVIRRMASYDKTLRYSFVEIAAMHEYIILAGTVAERIDAVAELPEHDPDSPVMKLDLTRDLLEVKPEERTSYGT